MKYNIKKIIIGSRESMLAKAHVEIFKEKFYRKFEKNLDSELITKFIKTSGDKFLSQNISEIGNKGLFTKEIDLAQLDNKVDVGVHSLKDLPTRLPDGLEIVSILKRGSHQDVLYSNKNLHLMELKQNSIIGTSSIRRKNQIFKLRPDLIFEDLRGNVDSRVGKVQKGKLERKTLKLMSEVVSEIFPNSMISVLSGPNFSSELIKKKPSASVLSSKNRSVLKEISDLIIQEKFRTYFNNDIIGTQIGGAMKNIIAIACGYIAGCGLGENAKAAIITRGLSEIIDLGIEMGAKRNTFYGLSGIGDLTLSCSSLKSRNAKFGYNLAKSKDHPHTNILLEGIESCESICALGEKLNVDLPISKSVKSIINGGNANKIICELLSRPLQFEK